MDSFRIRRIRYPGDNESYVSIRIYDNDKYKSFRCDSEVIISKMVEEMSKFIDKEKENNGLQ